MMIGLPSIPSTPSLRGRRGGPQIITATIAPALGPLEHGDTIASGMSENYDQTSNYASSEGTISSVVAAVTVNGSPALFTDTVDFEDVVAVTVTVTDSEANERVFNAGTRTVAGIAPTNDVAPSIAGDTGLGDTLTVTAGTWSGVPAPALTYQWLRDGVEIAGETGTTYDITLADSGALITVRETATNAAGSASEVSNAITADVFTAPDAFTAPDWDVANDGETVSVNIITLPADGGASITDLEYRVNAGAAISLGETTTGSYPITADDGDDIQVRAVNAVGAGDWSDVKAVPAGETFDPDALTYITAVETADGEPLEAGVKDAINAFVVDCKADPSPTPGVSNFAALKASCILAGARTLNGCLVPLKGAAPTSILFVTEDYTRKTGLKGDGSTKYLQSNRDNNADPQNSQHLAVYITETNTADANRGYIGCGLNENGSSHFFTQASRGGRLQKRSRSSQASSDYGPLLATGFVSISRSAATVTLARVDEETLDIYESTPSQAPLDRNIIVFGRDTSAESNGRLAYYSIGENIDQAALDARVTALMTALDGAIA